MAASIVQSVKVASTSNTGFTLTAVITPNAVGNLIVLLANRMGFSGGAITNVSDSVNGAYTAGAALATPTPYSQTSSWSVVTTTTAALTITVTASGAAAYTGFIIVEIAGQAGSPFGTPVTGNLASGSGLDIVTLTSLTASIGDIVLVVTGNYYAGVWAVGAANPPSPAPTILQSISGANAQANLCVSASVLAAGYTGKVSTKPGAASDYGNTLGIPITAGGGAPASPLFLPAPMSGIGAGGPFFPNPLN